MIIPFKKNYNYTILGIFIIVALFPLVSSGQKNYSDEQFYRVEIDIKDRSVQELQQMGVSICHAQHRPDLLVTELNGSELNILQVEGVPFKVLIENMTNYYAQRAQIEMEQGDLRMLMGDAPENFSLGSMGGYKTLEEIGEDLDQMHELFPDLISEKVVIGTTIEGRDIWAVWMGVDLDEPKPQVMYNSLIHAREPNSMMSLHYYMWWLLENYGTDAEATFILDNRHLAFVTLLNPDGYEYNRSIAPDGGGMHRKNRRPVGGEPEGIDLNRNFGPFEFWDHPNGGSSLQTGSQIYRGEAPFSEPETQALRDFVEAYHFRTAFNYHSYSNLLIYPYGALRRLTRDSTLFIQYAMDMTSENQYFFGTAPETVGYNVRGSSDDWFYGNDESEGPEFRRIISMTPEVGSLEDGFWPQPSRIIPLAEENVKPNKLLAFYAGPELLYDEDNAPTPDLEVIVNNDENYLSFYIEDFYNYGRTALKDAILVISSTYNGLDFIKDTVSIPEIGPNETYSNWSDAFIISINPDESDPVEFELQLELHAPLLRQQPSWSYNMITTGISTHISESDKHKKATRLYQNFPNPSQGFTNIAFFLEQSSIARLELMDATGQIVKVIMNQELSEGLHQFPVDVQQLPAGVYTYRLKAGNQYYIRKMSVVP